MSESPDIVILDVMMPRMSGLDVCKQLKAKKPSMPIIMLTARGQEVDKVVGLELGADDYVTKPFSIRELLARVKAVLRRAGTIPKTRREIRVWRGRSESAQLLQNGANEAAPAACSSEAIASLAGNFLSADAEPLSDRSGRSNSLGGVRVLINGTSVPVLYASSERVDFLCPAVPPSTLLGIAVETAAGLSNRVESRVEEASPGIFATGSPSGSDPILPGGTVSIRATGLNWLAKFPTVRPLVRIGTQYVPIESITPDPEVPGVSTLTVTLPADISGDSVPVIIEVVQTDGSSVTSNPASILIETRQRAASNPPIVQ